MGFYVDAWVSGLTHILAWPNMGLILLGVALGIIVGVLPGVGGSTMLVLLLPFTFAMDPFAAFALLLATASVAQNSSDLTSILFGVPGDGASAALVVDGYPMTKRGEAARALSGNLVASLVGAVIGAFSIMLAVPIVRPLVMALGSSEMFMLTILALTFLATLSSKAVAKGLVAGLFGLLIAMIGQDATSGIPRYTFGQLDLWGGVGIVPVALGLFAIPELFNLSIRRSSIADAKAARMAPVELRGVLQGIRDVVRHRWLVTRCSLIGTFIGVVPGMGASVAQWVAYGHAVQTSPDKERFGKGAPEGALGPGAANNSGLGGSLIPTVAFGVPGGLTTAILLGAFLIQGLHPGPDMVTVHLDLTMSFVWTIVIANIVTVLVLLPVLKHLARITFVRGTLLLPIVMMLVFIGSFANRNNYLDVLIALLFGLLGIIMVRLGWPRPPLILGVVLGGLMERYLFRSVNLYGLGLFFRPIVLLLLLSCVAVIAYSVYQARKGRSPRIVVPVQPSADPPGPGGEPGGAEAVVDQAGETEEEAGAASNLTDARRYADLAFGTSLAVIGVIAVWVALDWRIEARIVPMSIAGVLALLATGHVVFSLVSRKSSWGGEFHLADLLDEPTDAARRIARRRGAGLVLWMVGFFAAIWAIGFSYGSALVSFLYLRTTGREGWAPSILITAAIWGLVWILQNVFAMPLGRIGAFL